MKSAKTIDALAVRVCQAVRDVREPDQAWIGIDCLNEFLAIDDVRLVDAALASLRRRAGSRSAAARRTACS